MGTSGSWEERITMRLPEVLEASRVITATKGRIDDLLGKIVLDEV
jgi:hypothetical protein